MMIAGNRPRERFLNPKEAVEKNGQSINHTNRKRQRGSQNYISKESDIRSVVIVESNREIQFPLLISQFNAIEKVLNNLYSKRRIADWNTVKDAATRFCGGEVLLSDVNTIMDIYPGAYSIYWRKPTAERKVAELCLKLPNESIGKFETRSNTFRQTVDDWCSLHPGNGMILPGDNHIPPKPELPSTIVQTKAARCTVSSVASIALNLRNSVDLKRRNVAPIGTGSENLISLREKAILRDQTRQVKEDELSKEKSCLDLRSRIMSLPSLCDALRSICLTANRTCIKTSELITHLVSELFLTPWELAQRLQILSSIIPEFLTLVPADLIVPVSTVRLNLSAPYGIVRKKVTTYVAMESERIQEVFGSVLLNY